MPPNNAGTNENEISEHLPTYLSTYTTLLGDERSHRSHGPDSVDLEPHLDVFAPCVIEMYRCQAIIVLLNTMPRFKTCPLLPRPTFGDINNVAKVSKPLPWHFVQSFLLAPWTGAAKPGFGLPPAPMLGSKQTRAMRAPSPVGPRWELGGRPVRKPHRCCQGRRVASSVYLPRSPNKDLGNNILATTMTWTNRGAVIWNTMYLLSMLGAPV